jgi:ElaB/YqjD/DUF883 family membrane-anchored ribosome-binding protein
MSRKNGHTKGFSSKTKEALMNTQETLDNAEELGKKAEKGYGKLREKIRDAGDDFETLSANARRNAEDALDNTVDLIRENPLPALGIALLVGASLGALLTAWASQDNS